MTELYRPANGTEGEIFMEKFCYRCEKYGGDGTDLPPCPIQGNVLTFSVHDPKYPKEWCYDANGKPQCTAFEAKASNPQVEA